MKIIEGENSKKSRIDILLKQVLNLYFKNNISIETIRHRRRLNKISSYRYQTNSMFGKQSLTKSTSPLLM